MKTWTCQLTLAWFLLAWGGSTNRFAYGPVRAYDHDQERARTIGFTVTLFGGTIGLAKLGSTHTLHTTGTWHRDFGGRRVPRWTVGGHRTTHPVPISIGWVRWVARWPSGLTITLASRTLYASYLCSIAEYRPVLLAKQPKETR
ncbi:hypothetical protein [Streptomyces sp. NPDC088707]|uniref:hypothetical protein n=1 Tax=Streptomyces sp. NPDC088707 TaxID=3365871 RepID=UPI003822D7E8